MGSSSAMLSHVVHFQTQGECSYCSSRIADQAPLAAPFTNQHQCLLPQSPAALVLL